MSWSIKQSEPTPLADLRTALLDNVSPQVGYGAVESSYAALAAIDALCLLAISGTIGKGPFVASANGHSNPGHKAVDGWSEDFMVLSIRPA